MTKGAPENPPEVRHLCFSFVRFSSQATHVIVTPLRAVFIYILCGEWRSPQAVRFWTTGRSFKMPYRYQHWQPCVSRDPNSSSPAPGWTSFLLRPDLSLLIMVSRPKKGRTQSTDYQARYYLLSCKHISDLHQWNHDKSSAATYPMMSKSVQCRILNRIQDRLGIGVEKFHDYWDATFDEKAHRPDSTGRYPVWSCSDLRWKGPVQGGGRWRFLGCETVS